jgi:hypothetical protein
MNMEWRKHSTPGNESPFLQMIAPPFSRGIRINVFSAADAFESAMKFREWENFLFQKEESKQLLIQIFIGPFNVNFVVNVWTLVR